MDMLPSSFLPGDPRLINHIVYELKSQGIFDQFRKECIADVDTKPAYQNLSQRVEGSVMNFLKKQKFAESINKNQLREHLRKNITESGFLESGVERIVDQVVNPKINSVFLPKVEDVVYRFLGIERPTQEAQQSEAKPEVDNLLPQDLEAVSPKSMQDEKINGVSKTEETETLNSSEAKTEDESPSFEPLENSRVSAQEENSDDSHLSGISGLSHSSRKNNDVEMSTPVEDISQQREDAIASEQDIKMELCETTEISGVSETIENLLDKNDAVKPLDNGDEVNVHSELAQYKPECKSDKSGQEDADGKKPENSKRSHDRHKSSRSDKREHKDKKERSKSESKSKDHKEKTSSKHSSSNKESLNKKDDTVETDKAKKEDKDRNKTRSSSSSKTKDHKNKPEKRDKSKEKSEKDKERTHKDKERPDKDKSSADKANKLDKSKSSKDKEKSEKSRAEKATSEKDKTSKISKEKSSKTENKDKEASSKEKGPTSTNMHSSLDKSSSKSSKDKSKGASTSSSKDKDKKVDDPKSKSTEKHKKDRSSSSNDKVNLSSRKDKEKKLSDDHYSFKDKKNSRRSTDRDSNDGSSKMSRHDSTTETGSNSCKGSSKESSEVFSSGGGESSNSENIEQKPEGDKVAMPLNSEVSAIKYLKPKFASNIHEAMKLMKIRKQLAKMEKNNLLALTAVLMNENGSDLETQSGSSDRKTGAVLNSPDVKQPSKEPESPLQNMFKLQVQLEKKVEETQNAVDESPVLKSQDISLESFAALEARLALEMSAVNNSSYGYADDDDYVQYSSLTTSPVKQRKLSEKQEIYHTLFEDSAPNSRDAQIEQPLNEIVSGSNVDDNSVTCSQESKTRTFVLDQNSDEEIELAGGMQSKSRTRKPNSILRTVLSKTESHEIPTEKNQSLSSKPADFVGFSNVDKEDAASSKLNHLLEQVGQEIFGMERETNCSKLVKCYDSGHNFGGSVKRINGKKLFISLEKTELKMFPLKSISLIEMSPLNGGFELTNFKQNGQKNETESKQLKINSDLVKEWESDDIPCCFFEKPDTVEITKLNRLIEELAASIEKQLEQIANSSLAIVKHTCKRKLPEKDSDMEPKFAIKRPRLNEIILDQNMCNANLSSHQNFNFPLSPADSEKSGEQKKDEPTPVKPRKSARGSTSQRYSTDELYKPRPVLGCSGSRRKCSRRDSMDQS